MSELRTSGAWASRNPVLDADVIGIERNTGLWKVGDGTSRWNDLPYKEPTPLVAGSDPGALTVELGSTAIDGTLESISGVGSVSEAAVSRNFAELSAKIDALREALADAGVLE